MISAWYGGLKPGLLATMLSGIVCFLVFISPRGTEFTDARHLTGGGIFLFSGIMISFLCETLHRTRRRLVRERKKLHASAERERARIQELEALFDAVPAAISIAHDTECRRVTRSRAGYEVFGQAEDEANPLRRALQRAAQGFDVRDAEMEKIAADGERRILYGNAVALRDAMGSPRGALGAFVDITELKRAESARQMGEARFRLLAQTIPSILWMADPDGSITYANDQWYQYCGLSPEESVHNWPLVVHPEDYERCIELWSRALREGTEFEMEVRNRRHDGCYRWFLARGTPMKNAEGRLISWFGVTTDIHDLKEMQERLREDDRRKDEFLATLAHELRNPLAPLRNSLEIMKRSNNDPALTVLAQAMMERQLHHMVRMVDDLLDLSRLTRGRLELRKERFNLTEILTTLRSSECGQHQLTITVPEDDIFLDADPIRIAQVFSNLLHNACKFSEPGQPIRITASLEEEQVTVRVRDRGIGIANPMLGRIFEMFTQGGHAPGEKQDGLGIGLTLVKRIVEMHGGEVEARSDGSGTGSEFVVRLPLRAEDPRQADSARPAARGAKGAVSHPARRILVVDDNHDAAESLAVMLRVMGNEVIVSHEGSAAITAAAEFLPEMVMLDIAMPGLNGHETARRMRMLPSSDRMVLVAITGYGQEHDRSLSFAAGFDHHLVKPVNAADLESILEAGVHGAPASAS